MPLEKTYERRKETVEQVFDDAKEKYAMRYTSYRGFTAVTNLTRLKPAAVNLKKLAIHTLSAFLSLCVTRQCRRFQ